MIGEAIWEAVLRDRLGKKKQLMGCGEIVEL